MKGMLFRRTNCFLLRANHTKIWLIPHHKLACLPPTIFPKIHCFCNFHAVFGDSGHNAPNPTEGPHWRNPAEKD